MLTVSCPPASAMIRGVAVRYSRRAAGICASQWITAHALAPCPAERCASSTTTRSHGPRPWLRCAAAITGKLAYVHATVTRPPAASAATRPGSVVTCGPAPSSSRTAGTSPAAPASPHTATTCPAAAPSHSTYAPAVCASKSSVGTTTSTRPAGASRRDTSAPTTVLPVPHAATTVARPPPPSPSHTASTAAL